MTGSRSVARNTLLNLVGQGAPMVVALVAIPLLIDGLGTARFGVLTLAWMAIGYFSLFDLGMSRAITHLVAETFGAGREEEVPVIAWSALSLMALLGCVGAIALALTAPWLVTDFLQVPLDLQRESLSAFYVIAVSIPWVVSTAGLRGILEALHRFDLVNVIRVPMGLFTFLGPLLVLPFSQHLGVIVLVLLAGRILAWICHLLFCLRAVPALREFKVSTSVLPPMLRFGSWLTVSNIVSPVMDGLDRFIVGAVLSMNAVAYYVTPYEVVTKLWIITAALLGVLFPAFAASASRDRSQTALLFDRGIRFVILLVLPIVLVVITFAHEGLTLWLGPEFAENSSRALQWLAIGIFLNMIGQVAYTLIQGIGRPDITGKLHLIELPLYLGLMYALLPRFGVEGAAMAWAARAGLDATILMVIAGRKLPGGAEIVRRASGVAVIAVSMFFVCASLDGFAAKAAFLAASLIAVPLIGWVRLLTPVERTFLWALARPKKRASESTA